MINNERLKPAKRRILRAGLITIPATAVFILPNIYAVVIDLIYGRLAQATFLAIMIYIAITLVFAAISMLVSLIIWKSEFIYLEDKRITYEMTFFIKRKVAVPLENINVVKLKRGFWDLILGTTTIKIDSGTQVRSQQTELSLCFDKRFAVKYADYLRSYSKAVKEKEEFDELEQYSTTCLQESETKDVVLEENTFKMSIKDKFRYAFTDVGIMSTLFLAILFIVLIPITRLWILSLDYTSRVGLVFLLLFMIIIAIGLVGTTIISFISVFIRYYNYTIKKHEDGISIEYGLFTKKDLFVPYDKIHGYSVRSSIIQQVFNIGTIRLSVVGIDTEQSSTYLFLAAKKSQRERILKTFLPEFQYDIKLTKPNKKSLIHTILIPLFWTLVLFYLPLTLIVGTINIIIFVLLLIIIQILWGLLTYKNARLYVHDNVVVASCGSVYRRYTVTKTKSVQDVTSWQGFIRKKQGIATYYVFYQGASILGGNKVRNIPLTDLEKLK